MYADCVLLAPRLQMQQQVPRTELSLKIYTWMDDFGQNVNFVAITLNAVLRKVME